jgi:hypothetical protein
MHLHQAGLDQFKAGEEPGHLVPGAQYLRRGDALAVDRWAFAWAWWMSIAG